MVNKKWNEIKINKLVEWLYVYGNSINMYIKKKMNEWKNEWILVYDYFLFLFFLFFFISSCCCWFFSSCVGEWLCVLCFYSIKEERKEKMDFFSLRGWKFKGNMEKYIKWWFLKFFQIEWKKSVIGKMTSYNYSFSYFKNNEEEKKNLLLLFLII